MEDPIRPPSDPGFRLIETCRYSPEEGIHLRARHAARLARSAARMGIVPHGVEAALDCVDGDGPLRVRLTCDASGAVEVTAVPFTPLDPGTIWRVTMARDRVRSDDPWRGVKTTRREIYDRARASLPRGIDELFFLNERGSLAEGTITNVFADLGDGLVTPPVACGALPGVLREEMLSTGAVREAELWPEDLSRARALYVGNALRGLIPVRLR